MGFMKYALTFAAGAAISYFVFKGGDGSAVNGYALKGDKTSTTLIDRQNRTRYNLNRIDGETYAGDAYHNFEGFIELGYGSIQGTEKEKRSALKELKKGTIETLDNIIKHKQD